MEENILTGVGRIRRQTYWTRWLICVVIQVLLSLVLPKTEGGMMTSITVSLIITIFLVIQGVKRMHDCDKSGWYILIPIYNFILALTDGTPGPNEYGEDPKQRNNIMAATPEDGNIALESQLYPHTMGTKDKAIMAVFVIVVANVAITLFWTLFNLGMRNNFELYETLHYLIMPMSIITSVLVPVLGAIYTPNPSHKRLFIVFAVVIGLIRIAQEIVF